MNLWENKTIHSVTGDKKLWILILVSIREPNYPITPPVVLGLIIMQNNEHKVD